MSNAANLVRAEAVADHPGIVELVLDRPDALNAISTELAQALVAVTTELAGDRAVRAVVLTSTAPRAFCVGADLKERSGFDDDDLRAQRPLFRAAFAGLRDLPVPTVAAVHGHALGGGCELALSCDLIVASTDAVFGLPEVRVGLVPGCGGTQLLSRRIGSGRAADLILTGRKVEAAEAAQLGLVNRLVDPGQDREVAIETAAMIAANSPVAVRAARGALLAGPDLTLAEGLEVEHRAWETAAFSADRREGIAAFAEKRAPQWPEVETR